MEQSVWLEESAAGSECRMAHGRKSPCTTEREEAKPFAQERAKGTLQPILQRCVSTATTEC